MAAGTGATDDKGVADITKEYAGVHEPEAPDALEHFEKLVSAFSRVRLHVRRA